MPLNGGTIQREYFSYIQKIPLFLHLNLEAPVPCAIYAEIDPSCFVLLRLPCGMRHPVFTGSVYRSIGNRAIRIVDDNGEHPISGDATDILERAGI